tara:strand:+ start:543 stop:1796 length:1254 start_codon:yes stop_codon:yes gene_type:complete
MSNEYVYEGCVIEVGNTLKKRGDKDYEKIAANLCRMRVDEGDFNARSFAGHAGDKREHQRTFALELGESVMVEDFIEFPVIAITSGPHDEDGDQKVFIEPSILLNSIQAFEELPVYFNHQRTEEDLLGSAINPEIVKLDDGKSAIKMLARIHKDAAKAKEMMERIETGKMTHVSIDWLSKDVEVMGEPFATEIRPIEVSFIDNETRTPVCEACTIEMECDEHREFGEKTPCGCETGGKCACENGTHSEVLTMAEEKTVLENTETAADTIVEREFASMKVQLAEMKTSFNELTTKHEEALATINTFEEEDVKRAEELSNVRRADFVNTIIEKETLLGNVKDEDKDARAKELTSWDEVKLEGFSIAMASMPVPEAVERTFGKGKAHDDTEKAVEEAEETERIFALENGRIVFKGDGKGE